MLEAGTTVAGYRIKGLRGEGATATVYEAQQTSLGRIVALKLLAPRLGRDPVIRERFRREGGVQAGLNHPNIVRVIDSGDSEHGLWLAMDLIDGPTLRDLLALGRMSPQQTFELLDPIADALDYANDHHFVHRDITPQNILIDATGKPHLADFGITKGRDDRSLTKTGRFLGTFAYVSPEQIQDEETGKSADVYSLAAILFECLTGQVPFDGQNEAAMLFAHVHKPRPHATDADPSLPKALDAVLERGMDRDPDARQASAGELVAAARRCFEVEGKKMPPRRPRRRMDRRGAAKVDRSAATRTGAGPPKAVPGDAAAGGRGKEKPPRSRQAQPGRRTLSVVTGLLACAVLAGGAVIAGAASSDPVRPAEPRLITTERFHLKVPGGWAKAPRQATIPGLRLEDPTTLRPEDAHGAEAMVLGVSSATGETLLPDSLRDGGVKGEPVSLGKLEALRYRGLDPPGEQSPLTVLVAPASFGVVTIVCRPFVEERRRFLADCAEAATTLEVDKGSTYPLGPSPAFARSLRSHISTLDDRRRNLRRKLVQAGSASVQASSASKLAAAFRRAAHGLAVPPVTPQSADGRGAVVAALRIARDAYKELAVAAGHEDARDYAKAAKRVASAEKLANARLAGLRRLGYEIGSARLASTRQRHPGKAGKGDRETG